jgi:zinc protease
MVWHSPAAFSAGDAEMDMVADILAGGKNSRLYKRLVYELQIAQDVSAYQYSKKSTSSFHIVATARSGKSLVELEKVIGEEIQRLKNEPPSEREVTRSKNQYEANFLNRLENIGSFGGKADQLNNYYYLTGNPDYFNEDLSRYFAIDPKDISAFTQKYLSATSRVVLSVIPKGSQNLSAGGPIVSTEGK